MKIVTFWDLETFRYNIRIISIKVILYEFYILQAGQKLTAVIVLTKSKKINIENILDWCNQNMDDAEIPTTFKIVDKIERDNFGHVDKLKLRSIFPDEAVLCFHDSNL